MQQATGNRQQATGNRQRPANHGTKKLGNASAEAAMGARMLQTFTAFRKGSNIAHRLLLFASAILRIARELPGDPASKHIGAQIMRAATSIGANYEEARAAESGPDFIHKVGIANKELRETLWWLALIDESQLSTSSLEPIAREGMELAAILTASIRTARKNHEALSG